MAIKNYEEFTLFDMIMPKYKIDSNKKLRIITTFSGYDSQALALKYLGVNFEHYRTCEWAVKSIQALKDLHFGNDNTDYSKEYTLDYIYNYLYNKGISSNYLDPPYTNTTAIYNENIAFGGWSVKDDKTLFAELDRLNKIGVKWALSNVLKNKGKENNHIKEWAIKNNYKIIYFEDKKYASLGKGNAQSQEVMICNYQPPFEKMSLFDLDY